MRSAKLKNAAPTLAIIAAAGLATPTNAQTTIAEIAPPSTVFILGADNMQRAQDGFERAGFAEIWNDPSVQSWISDMMEDNLDELDQTLDRLGFSRDDFTPPTGPAGLALFIEPDAVEPMQSMYHFVATADFGDNANTTHEFVTAALERGVDEGEITLVADEYRGTTVWTIAESEDNDNDDEDQWEDWDDNADDPWDELYYTYTGNTLMMASSLGALETGIDRLMGDAGESVADSPRFAETIGAVGGEPHAYTVGIVGPWLELSSLIDTANEAQATAGMAMPAIRDILDATGLEEVTSFGMGVNFDTPQAAVEQNIAVLMPERRGLLSLIPDNDQPFQAPDFAPANATSLTMLQADIANLIPTIQNILRSLPAQFQQQAMGPLMMAQGMASPILNNLGPQIYIVQTIERPFAVDSQKAVVAIKSQNAGAVRDAIASLVTDFSIPLQQRDFAGNTLWEFPDNMGGMMGGPMGGADMPVIAVGAGHLFIGNTQGVEAALRTASNNDAPRLADDPRFQRAIADLRGNGLSFSWSNLQDSLEYIQWTIENQERITRQQLREQFGEGPDADQQIEEMMQWMGNESPDWLDDMPDASVVFNRIGDTVSEMRVTPRGIIGTVRTLRPE